FEYRHRDQARTPAARARACPNRGQPSPGTRERPEQETVAGGRTQNGEEAARPSWEATRPVYPGGAVGDQHAVQVRERLAHLEGALGASLRPPLERVQDDLLERGRDLRPEAARRLWILFVLE